MHICTHNTRQWTIPLCTFVNKTCQHILGITRQKDSELVKQCNQMAWKHYYYYYETNVTSARERKYEKYSSLVQDIISRGFSS